MCVWGGGVNAHRGAVDGLDTAGDAGRDLQTVPGRHALEGEHAEGEVADQLVGLVAGRVVRRYQLKKHTQNASKVKKSLG